jgi:hypothetical protein
MIINPVGGAVFQVKAKSLEYLRPCLADGFNLQGAGFLVVQLAGFLGHALSGYAAGRQQNMGMVIPGIVAALGRV